MSLSLSAQHVVKRYGGVVALADGNLEVESGQVVALLGANGSGKSTLGKIITGVVAPNEGQLLLDNRPVTFSSPLAAKQVGITAVYQELSLIPEMTIAENIWLSHEPMRFGRINRRQMQEQTADLLALFAGTIPARLNPLTPIYDLTPDERQIVEILKSISQNPRLVIFDEATASLDSQQVNRLFELIQQWKNEGMAIVFVSHRMDEIFRVADQATVLRNGRSVGTVDIVDTDEEQLVHMMIEGATPPDRHKREASIAETAVRLKVKDLTTEKIKNIDFTLHDGELLGIGGLQGQGQADLLLALFGAIPFYGNILYTGDSVHFTHPRQAMKQGIAFVPGDRGGEGLLLSRSIFDNLLLPSWLRFGVPLQMQKARAQASETADDLNVVMGSLDAPVNSLSGGNAQKIVIGKWLMRDPKLLLLNDPTKGVDVGAKGEFYNLLTELQKSGTAILFYSSDDEELLGLCDRILVMHDGRVRAELADSNLTRQNLVSASMGGFQHKEDTTS
jgi:ribose transport system ATP-binding protein